MESASGLFFWEEVIWRSFSILIEGASQLRIKLKWARDRHRDQTS